MGKGDLRFMPAASCPVLSGDRSPLVPQSSDDQLQIYPAASMTIERKPL